MRVQLIAKFPDTRKVESYGVSPVMKAAGLYVEDERGGKTKPADSKSMSYPSDFRFRMPEGTAGPYTLTIPFLLASNPEARSGEVSLPVPPLGESRELNVEANVAGFPVTITRIERVGETGVNIDADLHFDASQPETLQSFRIRYTGSPSDDSFSWQQDDRTFALKSIGLQVKPGQTQLQFAIIELRMLIMGPWRIKLTPE